MSVGKKIKSRTEKNYEINIIIIQGLTNFLFV